MDSDTHLTETAGATASRRQADLWSLVLWATGIPHLVVWEEGQWLIKIEPQLAEYARRELAQFDEENRNWPPARPFGEEGAGRDGSQPPTVLLMGALVILYTITGPWADHSPWFARGAVMGSRILEHGEWWRLVTGLTLHAGPVHLWSNVLIGGVLAHFFCKSMGTGLGWGLILLSGTLGNLANILMHGTGHNSVGFSTAIFGTIGMLSGRQTIRQRAISGAALLPLAAGFGLLAMLGAGGEHSAGHTDLGAHLFGLAAGLAIGVIMGILPATEKTRLTRPLQAALLAASALLVVLCWLAAFRVTPFAM